MGTCPVAGIFHTHCLILTHKCSEKNATLNFLTFSKNERKEYKYRGGGAGREKRRISVPSSQERKELTRGPGKQVLPKLPGGGEKGAPGLAALRLMDCRGAERSASFTPVTISRRKASGASWNDIGRSANPAQGCSWSCHLGEKTHTRLAGLPCQFKRGYASAPAASPAAPRHPFALLYTLWISKYRFQYGPPL